MDLSNNYEESNASVEFWTVLKRRVLFNRRDWVREWITFNSFWLLGEFKYFSKWNLILQLLQVLTYLRFFAYILIGSLIGMSYKGIGYAAHNVLSNLGFITFNITFLTFTSVTIAILSCEFRLIHLICKWLRKISQLNNLLFNFRFSGDASINKGKLSSSFIEIILFGNHSIWHDIPGDLYNAHLSKEI